VRARDGAHSGPRREAARAARSSELAAGKPARRLELLRSRKKAAVVLVGHEPNLSISASAALTAHSLKIAFRAAPPVSIRRRHCALHQMVDAAARTVSQALTFSP
jgi:phosphohistidine phosphatase SixA